MTELANWVAGSPTPMPANYNALAGYGVNPYDARLPRYALAVVAHLWLVDPSKRRLEVYVRVYLQWILLEEYSGSAAVSAPPFEAIAVELTPLWV
jgi:Uma2 family endonuclease